MELAKLIAPNGIWGKVWLAAHWERKLKKQDYQEIDLRSLLATISAKRSLVSLRATGHLLVGACKIYCKQSAFLEEEADEVRAGLMMAFSRPTEEPEVEISGRIREVRPGALTPILADDQALLGGKKHIARLEDITLKNQGKEDAGSIVASDDLFGALSQTELQEVMRAVRRKVVPKGAFEELESAATGEHHDFDTLPLVALSDQPKAAAEPEEPAVGEDVMPLDMELALEDEAPAAPAAAAEASTSPVPYAQEEVIDIDDLNQVAGQAAVQLVPLSNLAVARQLIMLGEEEQQAVLGFFQAQRREEIQTLLDQAPDSLAVAGDAGDGGYGGFPGDAMPVSHAYFEGTLAPFERPTDGDGSVRKKRRTQFVADELPEIPKETYRGYMNDRDKITRKGDLDYHLMLPHYSPHLPNFTTTFTDMCKTLCEGILWGSEVAEKRRRLTKDAEPDRVFEAAGVFTGAGGAGPSQPAAMPEEVSILTEEQRNNLSLYVKQKTADKPNSLAPLLGPVLSPDKAGLRSPGFSPETPLVTETLLLENAPGSMNAVVTGNQDDEDQSGNPTARIGYSGRTEKMHRFLAREFRDAGKPDLSYEDLCRSQTQGRRELIAGCFFELLVLKTNGVINVEQDDPLSDIKIAKAAQWAK